MTHQTTIRHSVSCEGIGLHTGKAVTLTLHAAPADHGIVFRRTDVKGRAAFILAQYDLVTDTRLGTKLTNKHGIGLSTIEHLMAALWGEGVDNALIEVSGPEVPIMDGSSEPFLELIAKAGIARLNAPRKVIRILSTVSVEEGESFAAIDPFDGEEYGCSLDVSIAYPHKLIPHQRAVYDFTSLTFRESLARARTFGFAHEVEYLRSQGLALGGSLENAVVVGQDAVLNEEGLRYPDEFIRHKTLDCLGDLYLAGHRIEGQFTFQRPGHGINNKLLRALFTERSAWKLVTEEESRTELPAREYAVL